MKSMLKNKQNPWRRALALLCTAVLLLTALVGCNSYDPSADIDALRDDLTEQMDTLKTDNAALQSELDALKVKYDAAIQAIDAMKTANTSAEQKLNTLRANYEAALQKINEVEGDYTAYREALDALTRAHDEALSELEALEASYAELSAELDSLRGDDGTPSAELEALRADYAAAMLEIEELRALIEDLKNVVDPPKIKIYIDQGHNPTGYKNAGVEGNGLYEQDLTFSIGKLLANMLIADGRFEICLSRPTSTTVLGTDSETSLKARVDGAKEFSADFFISLHINAFETTSPNGVEVHVAEDGGESYAFGGALLDGMLASTGLNNRGMRISPNLYVLENATMPAALLEMGFITNEGDAAFLKKSSDLFAEGIYDGLLSYFNLPPINP